MNPTIDFTMRLVRIALSGQVDKSGESMFSHAVRVHDRLVDPTTNERHAALLHDVIEDTDCTFNDLFAFGYSTEVIDMVELLTHDTTQYTYREYVHCIKDSGNVGAIKIKLADNSDPRRHVALVPIVSDALQKRYAKAREILA